MRALRGARVCVGSTCHGAAAGYAASYRQVQLALRCLRLLAERRPRRLHGFHFTAAARSRRTRHRDDIDIRWRAAAASPVGRDRIDAAGQRHAAMAADLWTVVEQARHPRGATVRCNHRVAGWHGPRDVRVRPGTGCVRRSLRRHSRRGRGWCRARACVSRSSGQTTRPCRDSSRSRGSWARGKSRSWRPMSATRMHSAGVPASGPTSPWDQPTWAVSTRLSGRSNATTRPISDRASSRRVPGSSADCWTTTPPSADWASYPPVRCNAPEFSAVVGADGRLSPCFFIPGPASSVARGNLRAELNSAAMVELREAIRAGRRPECRTCVCSLWRDAGGQPGLHSRSRRVRGARTAQA